MNPVKDQIGRKFWPVGYEGDRERLVQNQETVGDDPGKDKLWKA